MRRSNRNIASGISARLDQLRGQHPFSGIDAFLRTPGYIILLSVLTVVSNLLALDIVLYTIFVCVAVYICLLGHDLLPIMPMVILCYIAPSPANNPGSANNQGSIFYPGNGGLYLLFLAAVLIGCVLFRLVVDQKIGGRAFLKAPRSLIFGMLLLGCTYLLSGLGMKGYLSLMSRNLLFAVIQFLAVFGLYYLFTGSVDWERTPKDHLAWIGMCAGLVVVPQLMENYLSGRIFMDGTGTMDRELIYAGWGMHNNMGGLMAMMLPFPYYLAQHHRRGWVFNILGTVLMLGVVLSCSRTAMIVGALVYLVCVVLLLKRKDQRKQNIIVFAVTLFGVILLSVIFFDKLLDIFDLFFEELFIVSERDNLMRYGLKQFMAHPMFGGSFFPQGPYVPWDWSTSEAFSSFFPPRWHNTLVQLAASCGICGLIGYSIHRLETITLFRYQRSPEKNYIGLFICVLLICSLLDCHFFNVGPVLFYSMALAFAEKIHASKV